MATKAELLDEARALGIDDVDENNTNDEIQERIDEVEADQQDEVEEAENADDNETEEDPGPLGGPVGQGDEAADDDRTADEKASDEDSDYEVTHMVGSGGDVNLNPDGPKIGTDEDDNAPETDVPRAQDY